MHVFQDCFLQTAKVLCRGDSFVFDCQEGAEKNIRGVSLCSLFLQFFLLLVLLTPSSVEALHFASVASALASGTSFGFCSLL